jgi:hypothetical protein
LDLEKNAGSVCAVRGCGKPGTHVWGRAHFCCPHFDKLVADIFGIQEDIAARQHELWVRYFEKQLGRSTKIPGAKCEDEDDKT